MQSGWIWNQTQTCRNRIDTILHGATREHGWQREILSRLQASQPHLVLLLPLEALRLFRVLSLPRSFSLDSLAAPLSLERSFDFSSERSLRLVGEGALDGEEECETACSCDQTQGQQHNPQEEIQQGYKDPRWAQSKMICGLGHSLYNTKHFQSSPFWGSLAVSTPTVALEKSYRGLPSAGLFIIFFDS